MGKPRILKYATFGNVKTKFYHKYWVCQRFIEHYTCLLQRKCENCKRDETYKILLKFWRVKKFGYEVVNSIDKSNNFVILVLIEWRIINEGKGSIFAHWHSKYYKITKWCTNGFSLVLTIFLITFTVALYSECLCFWQNITTVYFLGFISKFISYLIWICRKWYIHFVQVFVYIQT